MVLALCPYVIVYFGRLELTGPIGSSDNGCVAYAYTILGTGSD